MNLLNQLVDMYRIDWNKYLSVERERESESKIGRERVEGNIDMRNEFESDFGRVIFSSAARRMHDKTQVFPLTSGDYVHTRLTHSLEVMNIAVSLGSSLCRNNEFIQEYGELESFILEQKICVILKTAAFVHDIGNPPFGHYGEKTIQDYFASNRWQTFLSQEMKNEYVEYDSNQFDFTEFDGNAEGFRILTRGQYLGDLYGLNLTYAALGAYLKYPNSGPKEKERYIGKHKHGILKTESEIFDKVVTACNMRNNDGSVKRHPLSFLVEAADTICYTVMDLEDGISLEKIDVDDICYYVDEYVEGCANHADFTCDVVHEGYFCLEKMLRLKDRNYDKKRDVDFRVALINYFVKLAVKNFITHLEAIDQGTYNQELLSDDPLHIADALGTYARTYLFSDYSIESAELTGYSVITGLLNIVLKKVLVKDPGKDVRIYHMLSESGLKLVHHECDLYNPDEDEEFELQIKDLPLYYRLRLVVDWISGMTDKYAVETYQKLSGIKL